MKRLDEDEWCKTFLDSVPFTVSCVLPPMFFFSPSLPLHGAALFVFGPHVHARVWWSPWICQLCVFPSFLPPPSLIFPSPFCFSLIPPAPLLSLLAAYLCFPTFPSFTFACDLFLFLPSSSSLYPFLIFFPSLLAPLLRPPLRSRPCLEGPMGALWFVCWKAYQHHRRHHWNLSLLSLFFLFTLSLAPSLFFPSSLFLSRSLSFFFPSSLFNVEVLSNCWLPLWLGGNGIFRRMPHAVASIHSRVPPSNHSHTPNTPS